MIEIKDSKGSFEGSDFEIYADLVALHSIICQEPKLMELDQMAMNTVKEAINGGFISELAQRKKDGETLPKDNNG